MILDIHSHHPSPFAVMSAMPDDFRPVPGQLYSVGIHPWYIPEDIEAAFARLEELVRLPEVVAIGECGLDTLKVSQSPMYRQLQVFERHVALSEKVGKPLIIHDVRAHQEILQLWRTLHPTMPWALHGFTAKPTVVEMFRDTNVWFSFGARYNLESLRIAPRNRVLAETDESPLSIEDIIAALSKGVGEDLTNTIALNADQFLTYQPHR